MGLIYNAITPSGTNRFKGQGSYRLQRKPMVAFPFFTLGRAHLGSQAADRRQHLHGRSSAARSYATRRTSSAATSTPSAICRASRHHHHAGQPGGARHRPSPPTCRAVSTPSSRSARSITRSTAATASRSATCSSTTSSPPTSAAACCRCSAAPTSPIGSIRPARSSSRRSAATLLNELRVQYATRAQARVPERAGGHGPGHQRSPAWRNFGGPIAGHADAGFGFTQNVLQVNDSADAAPGRSRVQGGPRRPARRRHAHARRSSALHLPEPGGLSGGA